MSFNRLIVALCFALAWTVGCASTTGGGGTNTNWITCETSTDCSGGQECVNRRCQTADAQAPAQYSIQVQVSFSAADRARNPTIGWVGDAPVPAVGAPALSRTFASADEAHAFAGTFVVYLDGQEVARETVGFGPCDTVSELGVDPQRIRSVFVHRSFDGGLSLDTHSNKDAPQSCHLSVPPAPSLAAFRRVLFRIPSNDKLTFSVSGRDVLPSAIQLFPDRKIWEVRLDTGSDQTANLGELTVLDGGQPLGSLPVSLEPCTTMARTVIGEDLWLALSSDAGPASVTVDTSSTLTCYFSDGTASSSTP